MMEIKDVVVVGSGNLAESLALAMAQSPEVNLVQIYARSEERASALSELCGCGYTTSIDLVQKADIYILAVSDSAVGELSESLPIDENSIVVHTAGSVTMETISDRFKNRGVFYPLQTFTKGRRVNFSEIPIFIEGASPELVDALSDLARKLSKSVHVVDSLQRSQLHLAAVYVCNFVNHLYAVGADLVGQSNLSFDMLKPLIAETTAKALDATSPAQVQTGPARRGDQSTMDRHESMLREPIYKDMYSIISKSIWETSKKI